MPLPRLKPSRSKKQRRHKAATWVWLNDLEGVGGPWCEGEIINLPGFKTIKYKKTDHDIIILAEVTTEIEGTCSCGEPASNFKFWGFANPTYVQDLPIRCKRARIYYRLKRKRCNNPKSHKRKTLQQPLASTHERHSLTKRLVVYIEQESFNISRNFSQIENETGVNEQTIRNLFTKRADALEAERKRLRKSGQFPNTVWIAIDEVHPKKNVEYCVITDPVRQQVLDILPVNNEKALFKWLLQLPKRQFLEVVVTIDMCPEYRSVIRRLLPRARIVVDRYHVHNLLNVALKQVLDVIRNCMTYSENHEHMRPEHLLLTSYRRLSEKREKDEKEVEQPSPKEVVDKWLKDVPDIARAHRLKEDFSDILQLTDRQKAEELTDAWLERVINFVEYFRAKYEKKYSEKWPDPFGNIPNTISSWRDSILNYIDCKHVFKGKTISNSFAEFTNGQIKKAYKIGNNYSYEVLRIKVVYGGVMIRHRPPHPLDAKQFRIKRKRASQQEEKKHHAKNPNANLEILKQAREAMDETKDLLPKPQANPAWAARFEPLDRSKLILEVDEEAPKPEMTEQHHPEEEDQKLNTQIPCAHQPFRYNPNQIKLF